MKFSPARIVVAFVAMCAFSAGVTAADSYSVPVGEYGTVEMQLPKGWEPVVTSSGSASRSSVQLKPIGDLELILIIKPIPFPEGAERVKTAVPATADRILRSMKRVAVEMDLSVQQLEGAQGQLHYVSVTDSTVREPSTDNYKYADQGAVDLGEIMATFTLLTNVKDAPERAVGLEIVQSMKHTPATKKSRRGKKRKRK